MKFSINSKWMFLLIVGAAVCVPLTAEEPARGRLKEIEVEGVVVRVDNNSVVVRSDAGEDYVANVDPRRGVNNPRLREIPPPQVTIVAQASPQQIRPGEVVAYEMEFDARGQPRHVVASLDILTGVHDIQLGYFRRREDGGFRKEITPPQNVGEGKYRIVGQITRMQGANILVGVPGRSTPATLDQQPHVEQQSSNHRFAQPGDRAVLHGVAAELPNVLATRLRVKRMERPQAAPPLRDGGFVAVPRGERPRRRGPGERKEEPRVVRREPPAIDAPGENGLLPPGKFGIDDEAERDEPAAVKAGPAKSGRGVRALRIN